MGYSNPDWTYGFSHNFSYKNFSLSLLFDGRIGGMMYSTTNQKMWWVVSRRERLISSGMMPMPEKYLYRTGVKVTEGSITYDKMVM